MWNLAAEFARLEGHARDLERISAIAGQFNAREASLASIAASLDGVRDKSVCILVDQFEELFRYEKETSRDEAELFVHLLQHAAGDETEGGQETVDLHVIVTMRRNSSANAPASPALPRPSTARNISCRAWTTMDSCARCNGQRRCMAASLMKPWPSA